MIKGKIFGQKELIAKLKKLAETQPDRVAAAIFAEANVEMTESKKRCPVWNPERPVPAGHAPGSLRASGTVHPPKREWRKISVQMSYGGAAVFYAIFVHEDPTAFHATGEWKYLESVLNESQPYMAGRLAARVHLDKVNL
jgi:hypothetical protein